NPAEASPKKLLNWEVQRQRQGLSFGDVLAGKPDYLELEGALRPKSAKLRNLGGRCYWIAPRERAHVGEGRGRKEAAVVGERGAACREILHVGFVVFAELEALEVRKCTGSC